MINYNSMILNLTINNTNKINILDIQTNTLISSLTYNLTIMIKSKENKWASKIN